MAKGSLVGANGVNEVLPAGSESAGGGKVALPVVCLKGYNVIIIRVKSTVVSNKVLKT